MVDKHWKGLGIAALFAFASACSDSNTTAPGASGSLSTNEAADVAEGVADAMDGVLDGEIAARPLMAPRAGENGIALSMVPVTTTFEFTRTRPCRNGGQIVVTGQGTHVADRETGLVTLDFEGAKSIEDCARARGDLVVTLNGDGTFTGHRMKENGQFSGLQTNHQEGSFRWETSDGRSGACDYLIDVVWDPATHTKTITGFVCDHEINRTVTRDRSAGDDGRGSS